MKPRKHRFSSNVIAPVAFVTDLFCLALAVPASLWLHWTTIGGGIDAEVHVAAVVVAGIAFFLIRLSRDAYARPFARPGDVDQGVVLDYVIAALLSVAVIWQFGEADMFSRGLMIFYVTSALLILFVSRFALRFVVRRLAASGHITQRVVLYGADGVVLQRAHRLLELERLPHLKIVGVADDRGPRGEAAQFKALPFLGGFKELVRLGRNGEIDQVLIALPEITQERLDEILSALSAIAIDVCLIPREALVLSGTYKVAFIGSAPILSLWQRPARDINGILKTLEDKILASIGLLLLLPVLIGAALAIKLTSRGPILFKQRRFGFNNTEIEVFKFRSMYADRQDETGAARTQRRDSRVTPVGRWIRRLSIDELPQLWNVIRGDMSLVGPRPHATHMRVGDRFYFDAVQGYAARHRVKPGITGLAQIRGLRGEIATIERARQRIDYDRYYIDNWSLVLDLRILFITVFKLIGDRNAY